jgi:hypothetical protein
MGLDCHLLPDFVAENLVKKDTFARTSTMDRFATGKEQPDEWEMALSRSLPVCRAGPLLT